MCAGVWGGGAGGVGGGLSSNRFYSIQLSLNLVTGLFKVAETVGAIICSQPVGGANSRSLSV